MGRRFVLGTATFLTVAWVVVLLTLVRLSERCKPDGTLPEIWIACRKANEIGDFLAGGFAPLAFIWLVTTVILQSYSLKTQSEQLALTQQEQKLILEELNLTRRATEAQLDEARKNLDLLASQVEIERTVSRSTKERQADSAVDTAIEIALNFYSRTFAGRRILSYADSHFDLPALQRSSDHLHDLRCIATETETLAILVKRVDGRMDYAIADIEHWLVFGRLIESATQIANFASPSKLILLEIFGLFQLDRNVKTVIAQHSDRQ